MSAKKKAVKAKSKKPSASAKRGVKLPIEVAASVVASPAPATAPAPYVVPAGKALMLRTCNANMSSHYAPEFVWPRDGEVRPKSWDPQPHCGQGLHGLLWGHGYADYLSKAADAMWLVCEIDIETAVVIADHKVKVPRAAVVFVGAKSDALQFIMERTPPEHVGSCVFGVYSATGEKGSASATGNYGSASATGEKGSASATGDYGSASATGDYGSASATGFQGSASATGNYGSASATGDYGSASATGEKGSSIAGYFGKAAANDRGVLLLLWHDAKADRHRVVTAYVGEDGIEPDYYYSLDANHRPVRGAPVPDALKPAKKAVA